MYIINSEIPTNKINIKSSTADLICKYKELYIIIEMNYTDKLLHINKNCYYLMKQHCSRINNKNAYGNGKKTILINFDNYDVINKRNLIYKERLKFIKYNECIYKNIEITHINLEYLREKYYNKYRLNELEKLLLLFVEQRKDKIIKLINREEVVDVMDLMDRLNFQEGEPVTYDREEFEKIKSERLAQKEKDVINKTKKSIKLMKKAQQMHEEAQKRQEEAQKRQEEAQKRQEEAQKMQEEAQKKQDEVQKRQAEVQKEEIRFAKELKDFGIPIDEIIKRTNLTENQIWML